MVVEIDGSMGEGGGQLLRYSAAIAAVSGTPIRVYNIRAKRSNPGLRPQHLAALKFLARLVDAETRGLEVGSTEIYFAPRRKPRPGGYRVDIGTAGSITLLLQAVLPVLLAAPGHVTLEVTGGTTVKWSPPYPYFEHVLVPLFRLTGARVETRLLRRGFYPVGGGLVRVSTDHSYPLKPIELGEKVEHGPVTGVSYVGNLPCHIAERQKRSAERLLREQGVPLADIEVDCRTPARGRGTGIVLWAPAGKGVVGGDSIGERGKPAEVVGREAAERLLNPLSAKVPVDPHASDNLVIYMSLAEGRSRILTSKLTSHAETALKLCSMITGSKHQVHRRGELVEILVEGVGLRP